MFVFLVVAARSGWTRDVLRLEPRLLLVNDCARYSYRHWSALAAVGYLYGQVAMFGSLGAPGTGAGRSTPHRIIMLASRDMIDALQMC